MCNLKRLHPLNSRKKSVITISTSVAACNICALRSVYFFSCHARNQSQGMSASLQYRWSETPVSITTGLTVHVHNYSLQV
jgi:hypothetical protein